MQRQQHVEYAPSYPLSRSMKPNECSSRRVVRCHSEGCMRIGLWEMENVKKAMSSLDKQNDPVDAQPCCLPLFQAQHGDLKEKPFILIMRRLRWKLLLSLWKPLATAGVLQRRRMTTLSSLYFTIDCRTRIHELGVFEARVQS